MNVFVLVPLLSSVIYGTLTVFAMLRPTRVRTAFAMYLFAAALWSLSSAMANLDLGHAQTHFWGKMIIIAGNPMMVFFYQFVRRFTNKSIDFWTVLGYIVALVILGVTSAGWILRDAYFIGGMLGDTAMVFTILALIVIYYTIYIYLLVLIETIFNIKLNKSE